MTRRSFVEGLLVGVSTLIIDTEPLVAQSFLDQTMDEWNHLVLMSNKSSSSLYLNGLLVANIASRGRYIAINLDGSIYITPKKDACFHQNVELKSPITTSVWLKVKNDECITLDQLRVFNKQITTNEFMTLYNERCT